MSCYEGQLLTDRQCSFYRILPLWDSRRYKSYDMVKLFKIEIKKDCVYSYQG